MAQKGQVHSYVATVPHKRTVSDRILLTDPMEIPMISALGLDNEAKFRFVNTPGKLYEWLNDSYVGLSTTGNDADLTNSSSTTTITVTDGSIFQVGDVLQLDDEYIWVSAVSGNDLTVGARPFGGTQATHASNVTITKRYNSRLEGAPAGDSPFTEPASFYNYTVIMQKTIEVSRTDARINQYGIDDVVDREIDKAMDELKMSLTRLPYYGIRAAGSATTPRSAGGFETFITNVANIITVSGALTSKNIDDGVQACWDAGGKPSLMVCNSWPKRKLADFYGASVRTERSERLGGVVIDRVLTALGIELEVLVDRHCPSNKIFILDTAHVGYITMDDFFEESLGKSKDTAYYGQVVGEYGFVLDYNKAHTIIKGFSTSL